MRFTKEQYESIARKIKLFSPAFEKGISHDEFERRLKAIEQQIIDKRLAWYEKNKDTFVHTERRSGDKPVTILAKALALLFDGSMSVPHTHALNDAGAFLHYYPDRKLYVAYIESMNFCPYLEAFKQMRLSAKMSSYLCKTVLEKPCQVIVEKVHPGIIFSRYYRHVRPRSEYCKEYMWVENYTPPSPEDAIHVAGMAHWGSVGVYLNKRIVNDLMSYFERPPEELNKIRAQVK